MDGKRHKQKNISQILGITTSERFLFVLMAGDWYTDLVLGLMAGKKCASTLKSFLRNQMKLVKSGILQKMLTA